MSEKKNTTPETTETKETVIRIPACVTRFVNKTPADLLPESVAGHLPEQVAEAKMKVVIPVAGVLSYLGYRLFRKFFSKKPEAPKAQ